MRERDEVDREIGEILRRLNEEGVGEKGPLIDSEGFPRADVDVARVRQDRNKLARLYNDHKEVTAKVERAILDVHSKNRRPSGGHASSTKTQSVDDSTTQQEREEHKHKQPFVLVDHILIDSPSEEAGMREGDQILEFGQVDKASFTGNLAQLVEYARTHENAKIEVSLIREGEHVLLGLTPKEWSGNGLLGCHMRKINA